MGTFAIVPAPAAHAFRDDASKSCRGLVSWTRRATRTSLRLGTGMYDTSLRASLHRYNSIYCCCTWLRGCYRSLRDTNSSRYCCFCTWLRTRVLAMSTTRKVWSRYFSQYAAFNLACLMSTRPGTFGTHSGYKSHHSRISKLVARFTIPTIGYIQLLSPGGGTEAFSIRSTPSSILLRSETLQPAGSRGCGDHVTSSQ